MKKRILAVIGCISLLSMIATGCMSNSNGDLRKPNTKAIKIGIAMPEIDEITQNLCGSYEKYAETIGNVEVIFTDAEGSVQQQSADIENLISQNCDVIVVRAIDETDAYEGIANACNAVINANIPLVIDGDFAPTTDYAVHVKENQSNHGRLQGEYLQGLLKDGTLAEVNIGYIAGSGDADMLKRMTSITETCPSASFVAGGEKGYVLVDNWSANEAKKNVEDWISNGLINDMNVIVCMNETLSNAVVAVLSDDYSNITVLGCGANNPYVQQNIQNGKMKAVTKQDDKLFVKKVLDVCLDLNNGVPIKFDDAENKTLDPQNIILMTIDTLPIPK